MRDVIEIYLPKAAADKLSALRANPADRDILARIETHLAASLFSIVEFAPAPPIVSVIGGAPFLQVHEIRANVAILNTRINSLIDDDDPEAPVLIEALDAYRFTLEREEEMVIAAAAAEGIIIARRLNADPLAILGIIEVHPAKTSAAA